MVARARRRRGGLLVLIGFLTIIAVTFGAGVYAGRIWMARSAVRVARVTEPEPPRRAIGRGAKPAEAPAPQLTFYRELTAPLTAPPPPPKPAKPAPPLVTTPPVSAAVPLRPGEQADLLGATTTPRTAATTAPRFTVQVASYRMRPQAEALREALASAGHDARVVEADAQGPVYRVQVGEFPTREAARALAARLTGERSTGAPIVTTR
ncbi:MAG TPA: SPOR domain-containing protein [Methylomirabilota bacterium]|jgi:cell division protein FtsN